MAKVIGSSFEYSDERMDALMSEYQRYIASCSHIYGPAVFEHIVNQPCRRFWVSNIRAMVVIADMLRGRDLGSMRPSKREMFREIFDRVLVMRAKHPGLSLYKLVSMVVEQPAPKFYLSPSSAKIMICKARKEWYRKRMQKL